MHLRDRIFFERCAETCWNFPTNWKGNLYIESNCEGIWPLWSGHGDIRKGSTHWLLERNACREADPAEIRDSRKKRKKESAADKAQKLMLTWLVELSGDL